MAQNAKFEQIGNVKKNHIDSKKPKDLNKRHGQRMINKGY